MTRSEHERLKNVMIGQAVLSLLYERGPINTLSLIARLKVMEPHETDPKRRAAIVGALADLSTGSLAAKHRPVGEIIERDRERRVNNDNVYPLFGDRQRSGSSKKH